MLLRRRWTMMSAVFAALLFGAWGCEGKPPEPPARPAGAASQPATGAIASTQPEAITDAMLAPRDDPIADRYNGSAGDVMLQGFHWESHKYDWYTIVRENAGVIRDAGYSSVSSSRSRWAFAASSTVSRPAAMSAALGMIGT